MQREALISLLFSSHNRLLVCTVVFCWTPLGSMCTNGMCAWYIWLNKQCIMLDGHVGKKIMLQASDTWQRFEMLLGWREKFVKVERQRVEFLAADVSFECPELRPPRHASIDFGLLHLVGDIQKHCHNQCHCCL